MGFAEKRDGYWRARYKVAPGKYATVKDANGATVRFKTRRAAKQAADEAEARVRSATRPLAADEDEPSQGVQQRRARPGSDAEQ